MPRNNQIGRSRPRAPRISAMSINSLRPPQFQSSIRFKHRFRFLANSHAGPTSITRANLLNLVVVGTASSTSSRIFSGAKLNRVEMWAVAGSTTTSATTTISVEWLSSYGPSSEVSDNGNSLNTAHLVTTPPRQSLASFWSLTGSNESEVLFNIISEQGCIVDVWVDFVLMDSETPVFNSGYTVVPTANQVYVSYLDGINAAAIWAPVSYTTVH